MNRYSQKSQKQTDLLKATSISSLLIGLQAMLAASAAIAMPGMEADKQMSQVNQNPETLNVAPSNPSGTTTSPLNPRPSIFNEPQYSRSRRTSTTDLNAAPTIEPTLDTQPSPSPLPTMEPAPGSTLQPPLPEEQQAPRAVVSPIDGKLNIKLINTTKAAVTYQVIGDTDQRTLTGDADVTLQDIKTPVTVTLVREDGGLLKVSPQATSAGLLEVTLDETTSLDESDSTMRVQQTGTVLLN